MNQKQINRLKMYQTKLDHPNAHNAIWSDVPIMPMPESSSGSPYRH